MKQSLLSVVIFGLAVAGCSQAKVGPERRAIQGTVTFQSKPLEYGVIRFLPEPSGPLASAIVESGNYVLSAQRGVPVGTVRVEIMAMAKESEGSVLEQAATPVKLVEIPVKYNSESTLKEQIPSGSTPLKLDFALTK